MSSSERAGATVSHLAKGDLVDRRSHGQLYRVLAASNRGGLSLTD